MSKARLGEGHEGLEGGVEGKNERAAGGLAGRRERVHVTRLNWAGLGVCAPELEAPAPKAPSGEGERARPRGDLCVPLSRVGEALEVEWRLDGRGRIVGERLTPPEGGWEHVGCPQALRCPGCVTRHLSAEEQREVITASHLAALERLSGRSLTGLEVRWAPPPARDGYRARLSALLFDGCDGAGGAPDALSGGMWARWGEPIDLARCPVQTVGGRLLLTRTLSALSAHHALTAHLERVTVQVMGEEARGLVVLHVKHLVGAPEGLSEGASEALIAALSLPLKDSALYLAWRAHPRAEPTLKHLSGPRSMEWTCDEGITLRGAPPAWLPQSPASVTALRETALRALRVSPGERVFEVGCGVGVLSFWLARRGVSLYGVDIEPRAIEGALDSLESQDFPLAPPPRFEAIDGRRGLATYSARDGAPDALLIHAMRAPIPGLLTLAAHLKIERVCYLAPSAPSLGRELAAEPRYALTALSLLSQTPGSAQAMCVATLSFI